MRAAVYTAFDGPDSVEIRDRADPNPGPGEAVVEVAAASVNRHDLNILEGGGGIGADDPPFVSGVDVGGEVASVGPGVDAVEPGDRVVRCPNRTCGTCRFCREGPENTCESYGLSHGGFAERVLVDADRLVHLPDGVDAETAAALPVAYMTAWHMLRRADAGPGDLVFVPGATGGVGVAAVQLVDVLGGRTIGTTTSPAKARRLADLGVDHVVESGDVDAIRQAVEAVGAPDVTVNHLGGPFAELGVSVLAPGGTMVSCGSTVGATADIDLRDTYREHKRMLGSTMGTQPELETLVGLVADGRLAPEVDSVRPLAELDEVFREMRSRELFGKALVKP